MLRPLLLLPWLLVLVLLLLQDDVVFALSTAAPVAEVPSPVTVDDFGLSDEDGAAAAALAQVAALVRLAAKLLDALGTATLSRTTVSALVRQLVLADPLVRGGVVAYPPGEFAGTTSTGRYAPYATRTSTTSALLLSDLGLVEGSYATGTVGWYDDARRYFGADAAAARDNGVWSVPYSSSVTRAWSTTYSVPFGNEDGLFGGVVAVEITLASFATDNTCGKGRYLTTAGQCQPCPLGSYSPFTNVNACQPCEVGLYAPVTGLEFCMRCPAGTYQPDTGQSECVRCEPVSYQPNEASTTCKACPEGSTSFFGADELTDCVCREGFFGEDGTQCVECPPGGECPGKTVMIPDTGFYRSDAVRTLFNECIPPEACLGGPDNECAAGYLGTNCAECDLDANYFRVGQLCQQCGADALSIVSVVALILAAFAIVVVELYAAASGYNNSAWNIIVNFNQIVNVIGTLYLNWPISLWRYLWLVGLFTLDSKFFGIECFTTAGGYYARWLAWLFMPAVFAFMFAIVLGLTFVTRIAYWWFRLAFNAKKPPTRGFVKFLLLQRRDILNVFMAAVMRLSVITYVPVIRQAFTHFACAEYDDGTDVLIHEPSVACYDETWYILSAPAILVLLIYGLAMPIWLAIILRRHRPFKHQSARFVLICRTLVDDFKDEYYFWNVVVMLRSVAILLCAHVVRSIWHKVTLIISIQFAYIILFTWLRPYTVKAVNAIQLIFEVTVWILILCGLLFTGADLTTPEEDAAVGVMILAFSICFLIAIPFMIREWLTFYTERKEVKTFRQVRFRDSRNRVVYRYTVNVEMESMSSVHEKRVQASPAIKGAKHKLRNLHRMLSVPKLALPNGDGKEASRAEQTTASGRPRNMQLSSSVGGPTMGLFGALQLMSERGETASQEPAAAPETSNADKANAPDEPESRHIAWGNTDVSGNEAKVAFTGYESSPTPSPRRHADNLPLKSALKRPGTRSPLRIDVGECASNIPQPEPTPDSLVSNAGDKNDNNMFVTGPKGHRVVRKTNLMYRAEAMEIESKKGSTLPGVSPTPEPATLENGADGERSESPLVPSVPDSDPAGDEDDDTVPASPRPPLVKRQMIKVKRIKPTAPPPLPSIAVKKKRAAVAGSLRRAAAVTVNTAAAHRVRRKKPPKERKLTEGLVVVDDDDSSASYYSEDETPERHPLDSRNKPDPDSEEHH